MMKKILMMATVMMTIVLIGSLAFGSPALLPKHPGYPMGGIQRSGAWNTHGQ